MAQFVYSNTAYVDTTLNRIVAGSNGLVIDPVSPSDGFEQNFSVYSGVNSNISLAYVFGDIYANTYSGAALSNNWFQTSINSTNSNMNLIVNGGLIASCNVAFAATGCNTCVIRKRSWYMQGFWNGNPTYCNVFANVSPLIDQGDFRYFASNCYLDDIQLQGVDNVLVPTDATYPGAPFIFGKLTCSNIVSPQINYNSNLANVNQSNLTNLSNIIVPLSIYNSNTATYCSNSAIPSYVNNSNFSISSNTLSNSVIVNEINCVPQNFQSSLDYMTPGLAAYKNNNAGCLSFTSNPVNYNPTTRNYQNGFSIIAKYFTNSTTGTIFDFSRLGFWHNTLLTSNNTCRFQSYNSNVLAIDASIPVNLANNVTVGLLYSSSNFQMWASDGSNTTSNIVTTSNNLQNSIVNDNELYGGLTGSIYCVNFWSNVIPPALFSQLVGLTAAIRTVQITNNAANQGVTYLNSTKVSKFIESNLAQMSVGSNLVANQNLYVGCNVTTSNALSNLGQGYFASNVLIGNNLNMSSQIQPNMITLYGNSNLADNSNNYSFGISNFAMVYNVVNGANHIWRVYGNEAVRINPSGQFGIGTSNPQYTLDVNGSANIQANANILGNFSNFGTMFQSNGIVSAVINTSAGMIETRYPNSNAGDRYGICQGNNGSMRMYTSGYYPTSTVGLTILSSANGFNDVLVCGQYGQYGSNYTVISGVLSNLGPAFFVNNVSVNGNLTSAITTYASNAAFYGSNTATSVSNALTLYATNSTVNANSNFIFPIGIYGSNTANYASNALANYQTSSSGTVNSSNIIALNITASNSFSNLGPSFFKNTINMSNVSSQLNLYGSNGLTQVYSHTDGNTYFQGQNNISICPANGIINPYIYVASNTRYVGVNTNSPNYNLDVNGTGNVNSNFRVGGIATTGGVGAPYGGTALYVLGYNVSNAIVTGYTGLGDTMNITVPGNSGNTNPALTLATNGPIQRVGILQSSPNYSLDVLGNANITSTQNMCLNITASNPYLQLSTNGALGAIGVAGYNGNHFSSATAGDFAIHTVGTVTGNTPGRILIGNNSTNAAITVSNNLVGINNNNSPQYNLDVSGNANFTGSITSQSANGLAAMIETKYANSNTGDRYGLWQGTGGTMRMYTSGIYQPATVGLAFTTSNNGYMDALVCGQSSQYGVPNTTITGILTTVNSNGGAYGNLRMTNSSSNETSMAWNNGQTGWIAGINSYCAYTGNFGIGNSSTFNGVFFLTPGGRCGIGNNNPQYTLDVNGSGNFNGSLNVLSNTSILNLNSSNFASINLGSSNAGTAIYAYNDGKSYIQAQNDFVLNKFGGTTNSIYLYGQSSTGYVGINTLNPQYNLDVGGSIRCTSVITASNSTTASLANNWRAFTVNTANGARANSSSFNQLQYKVSPADPDIIYINGYATIAGVNNFYNANTFSMQASDSNLFPAANRNVSGTYVYSPTGGVGTTSWKIDSSGNLTGLQIYTTAAANGSNITCSINGWFPRTGI